MLPEFSGDRSWSTTWLIPRLSGDVRPVCPVAGQVLRYFPHTPLTHLLVVVRRNVGSVPVNTGCTVAG